MSNNEPRLRGQVVESLPNLEFRVHLEGTSEGQTVRCYTAGKLRINRVHVLVGDMVDCVMPKGSAIGRIVFRHLLKKHWE